MVIRSECECAGAEVFTFEGNKIKSIISGVQCVSIPNNVESISEGSVTSSAFGESRDTLRSIDFSSSVNLAFIGDYAFYMCSLVDVFDLRECRKLDIIGVGAFSSCYNAKSILLPNSTLKSLPGSCFAYCYMIQTFMCPSNVERLENDFPSNIGVFYQCNSLQTVTFLQDSNMSSIGSKVFLNTGLKMFTIPKSLIFISAVAFRICLFLEGVYVEEGNPNYFSNNGILLNNQNELVYFPNKAQNKTIAEIPNGIISIKSYSFVGLDAYESVIIPSSIYKIEASSFYGFQSIKKIIIPSTVSQFEDSVFRGCSQLANISFENDILSIPQFTFYDCICLKEFRIPPSVKSIGKNAFGSCKNLELVYVPQSVATFQSGCFSGCSPNLVLKFENQSNIKYENGYLYSNDMSKLIIYLGDNTTANIISSVKIICNGAFQGRSIEYVHYEAIQKIDIIESYAFSGCNVLKSISFPNTETIESYTFNSCNSINSISIPSTVKIIKECAFLNCQQLKNITFLGSVEVLQSSCFERCASLRSIILPNTITNIENQAFYNCFSLETINLPSSLLFMGEKVFFQTNITIFDIPSSFNLRIISSLTFSECISLKTFIFPDCISQIQENSFQRCLKLETITIGANIVLIEEYSFNDCPSLSSVIIKNNSCMRTLSPFAFYMCGKLIKFEVNEYSNNFYFLNGVLFDREQTRIIIFLSASNPVFISIPATVTQINSFSFRCCTSLEKVHFEGAGIISLGVSSFEGCSSLKSINFPQTLETIGKNCFNNCNLNTINLVATNITKLEDHVFSNNINARKVILPINLNQCSSSTFASTNCKCTVLYFGTTIITGSAGFSQSTKVFCTDEYKSQIFLGIQTTSNLYLVCTNHKDINKRYHLSLFYPMIFISVISH